MTNAWSTTRWATAGPFSTPTRTRRTPLGTTPLTIVSTGHTGPAGGQIQSGRDASGGAMIRGRR